MSVWRSVAGPDLRPGRRAGASGSSRKDIGGCGTQGARRCQYDRRAGCHVGSRWGRPPAGPRAAAGSRMRGQNRKSEVTRPLTEATSRTRPLANPRDETLPIAGAGGPSQPAQRLLLDRYRLERRLGAGGFGVVWQAWDHKLEREVAVKAVPREGDDERAEREARAAARLNHPGIVALYELA